MIEDLHICEDSIVTTGSECECPPEYYCADICREDYSFSTLISWQHFPRSTSSRSRCDESSEPAVQSITETPVSVKEVQKTPSEKPSSTEYPIKHSISQLNALHYLEIRHVAKLLNFMMGHLVCNEPDDPVLFLENLLDRCLQFRDSLGEPPLLFTKDHVKSLYNAFDPFERGYITIDQYEEAMNTLGLRNGITQYNKEPPVNKDGHVEDSFVLFEAERCLVEDLREMLRIPKLAEENRLWWKMKMKIRRKKKSEEDKKESEEKFPFAYSLAQALGVSYLEKKKMSWFHGALIKGVAGLNMC